MQPDMPLGRTTIVTPGRVAADAPREASRLAAAGLQPLVYEPGGYGAVELGDLQQPGRRGRQTPRGRPVPAGGERVLQRLREGVVVASPHEGRVTDILSRGTRKAARNVRAPEVRA